MRWLGLAALNGFFVVTPAINAQAPVITNPRDLDIVATNEAFDSLANTWTTKTSMPTARDDISVSAVAGKIYVAGGEVFNNCAPIDTLEEYDPIMNTWASKMPMPTHRWGASATTVNGIMYVIGGQGPNGCQGALSTVEAYNPVSNMWATKTPMLTARFGLGVGVVNGIIYAIGGDDVNLHGLTTVEAFDPNANGGMGAWTTKTAMPAPGLYGFVTGVVNGKIYVIGGSDTGVTPSGVSTVQEFDPTGNGGMGSWAARQPIPGKQPGAAGGVINGVIYVVGGVAASQQEIAVSTVQIYNPSTDTWSTAPDMPTPRVNHGVAVANNILYAVGGNNAGVARVGQPFIYQITATNHPTSYGSSALPAGLSFDTTLGIIFGTPTAPSDTFVQFTATNPSGTGSASLRLVVQPALTSGPVIVSSTCATGRTGQLFSFQLLTTGGSPATHFTVGGLPTGLGVDPASGVISGTPTPDGNFSLAVTAVDGAARASATLQLTFISDTTVPIITSKENVGVIPGQPFSHTIETNSTLAVPTSFNYIGTNAAKNGTLPPGLAFTSVTASTITLSGTFTGGHIAPNVIKKEPPAFMIQPIASNSNGAGTHPLNFFEITPAAVERLPNGHVMVIFVGVPLQDHDVQASADLDPTHFTTVATITADGDGSFAYEDTNPGARRFYRVRYTSPSSSAPSKGTPVIRKRRR